MFSRKLKVKTAILSVFVKNGTIRINILFTMVAIFGFIFLKFARIATALFEQHPQSGMKYGIV